MKLIIALTLAFGIGGTLPQAQEGEIKKLQIEMNVAERGKIVLELYPNKAPKTVEQITRLAKEGFFDGQIIHRVENWVIQWGDPKTKNEALRREWGTGGSGKKLPFEANDVPMTRGVLAMASTGAKVGGDSQMFVLKKDGDWLQGDYCAFGRVVKGLEVIDAIERGDKIESMKVIETDD
jgi:cyclophilin family peptidyl-prolyl cis-trans isomerase